MLRCGLCEVICNSYEDWLSHLVSEVHQANLGVNDCLVKHDKDGDRTERSVIISRVSPKTHPYEVVRQLAEAAPLGFVSDAYVHIFPSVNERFYLIVFDQKKFVDRITGTYADLRIGGSVVLCRKKTAFSEPEWNAKLEPSFFYRRHEYLKRQFEELNWDQQLAKLLHLVSLDGTGYQHRESVIEELESLLHEQDEEFQNATVNPFGSCTTWLADKNADLDVFIDATGDGGRTDIPYEKKLDIMSKISDIMIDKYGKRNVTEIKNARVPIIILHHPTGLKIDISLENCLSVQNSKMIRLMTKLDYRVRPFLIFLRYWARYHNLIGPQAIKSYALILLAFVFLRKKKILPSVHELQNVSGTHPYMVCNWNASYCSNRELVQRHYSWLKCCRDPSSSDGMGHEIMSLCYGFFLEFMELDFTKLVVCPLIGDFLTKKAFDSTYGVELPKEMELLKANLVTGQCSIFQTSKPLCIQDPFVLNVNVTASCPHEDTVFKFRAACAQAAEALKPFIKTYGLADRENMIELVCQPVSQAKLHEIMFPNQATGNSPPNHDHLAYVKTEATTTTTTPEEDTSLEENKEFPKSGDMNETLESIKDFYKEQYGYGMDGRRVSAAGRGRSRDREDRETRSREKRSTQVLRVSAYGGDDENDNVYQPKGLVDYSDDTQMEYDDEGPETNPKVLKSIVVVANRNENRGESPNPRLKSSVTRVRNERSVSPSSTLPPTKKKNRVEGYKDSGNMNSSVDNAPSSSSRNSKKAADSTEKTELGENANVLAEQVVKFVRDTTGDAGQLAASQPSTSTKSEEFVKDEDLAAFYEFLKEGTPPRLTITVENEVSESNQDPESSAPASYDYGYKSFLNVAPKPKPNEPMQGSNHKTSSNQSESAETSPKERPLVPIPQSSLMSGIRFPDLTIFMDKQYQSTFLQMHMPIAQQIRDDVMILKMKYEWVLMANDFFLDSNFWRKIEPLVYDFESIKVESTKLDGIFTKVEESRQNLLNESNVKLLGMSDIKDVCDPSTLQLSSSNSMLPLWYMELPENYEALSSFMNKFSKLPGYNRKRSATAIFFMCHNEIMEELYRRWKESKDSVLHYVTINKGPLEVLAGICEKIEQDLGHLFARQQDLIKIKILVAHETMSQIPGVFIGFQNEEQEADPTFEKQVLVQEVFKTIMEDMMPMYVMHRIFKYLHK